LDGRTTHPWSLPLEQPIDKHPFYSPVTATVSSQPFGSTDGVGALFVVLYDVSDSPLGYQSLETQRQYRFDGYEPRDICSCQNTSIIKTSGSRANCPILDKAIQSSHIAALPFHQSDLLQKTWSFNRFFERPTTWSLRRPRPRRMGVTNGPLEQHSCLPPWEGVRVKVI
jgi:hypothetical protein